MLFNAVFRACRSADLFRSRKPMDVFCSVVEEVGELATELAVAGGGSYKEEGPDGVLGEIIDVISSVTDLAFVTDHQLTERVLLERMCPKLDKWLGKLAGVRCSVFVDSLGEASGSGLGEANFEAIFDSCVKDKLAEWLNYCNGLEKEKRGLKSGLKYFDEDDIRRLNALRDSDEFWVPDMGIGGNIPEDVINLDDQVGQLTEEAFVEGCKIMERTGGIGPVVIDARGLEPLQYINDLCADGGIHAGTVVHVAKPVDSIVLDLKVDRTVDDGERSSMVEVEKPTTYDPLIGDTGTMMVSVPKADDHTFYGQLQRMSQKAMDDITEEENKKAWGALLKVASENVEVVPVRMRFLELALGARFRYVVDGVANEKIWIKLSDWNHRDEKVGLVAEYDAKYITHRNWVGQSVCCAEDTEEKCESLVVELVG